MGSCSCITSIEEQTIPLYNSPQKQKPETIDNESIEIESKPETRIIQALIRSYFARKSFKKKPLVSKSSKIDIRQFLSQNLQTVLLEKSEFSHLAEGEVLKKDGSVFIIVNTNKGFSEGHLITKNSYYKGTFKNFQYHGRGTLVKDCGDFYVGSFKDGQFHGQGDFVSPGQKFRYSGSWHSGEHDGRGTEIFPDGSVCTADYDKGVKKGEGSINWKDGSRYSGSFFNDHFEGNGKYIWSDGRSYEGAWKDGLMEGTGKYCWPDGRKYEGDFLKSQKEGYGTFIWANGKKYEGSWKSGKQHGIGVLSKPGKAPQKGEWKAGKRIRWIDS